MDAGNKLGRNASEVFGDIMIAYSYTECTASCLLGLSAFQRRYPDFQRTCDVEFIEAAFESPQVAARIEQLRSEPDSRLTFAVCCDEDCRSLITALELKAMLHDREAIILARMSARSGLAALLCGNEPGTSPPADCAPASGVEGIHPFGMLETLSTPGVD